MADKSSKPREYRLAPEFIRASRLAAAGMILILAAMFWTGRSTDDDVAAINAGQVILSISIASILVLMSYRWRLRIDREGLYRRRFFLWDTWRWTDFQNGSVSRGYSAHSYIHNRKSFHVNVLSLASLAPELRDDVNEICLAHLVAPPLDIPDSLTLKRSTLGPNLRVVTLGPFGVEVSKRRSMPRVYLWADVVPLEVTRIDRSHPSFRHLVLTFPEFTLDLRCLTYEGSAVESWSGAKPERVIAYIERYVPPGRTTTITLSGPLESLHDVEGRKAELWHERRQLRQVILLQALVVLGLLISEAVNPSVAVGPMRSLLPHHHYLQRLAPIVIFLTLSGVVIFHFWKGITTRLRHLEKDRARFAERAAPSPPKHE